MAVMSQGTVLSKEKLIESAIDSLAEVANTLSELGTVDDYFIHFYFYRALDVKNIIEQLEAKL